MMEIKRVIMWGHRPRPGANTLSFVWNSFAKAWRHLGYEVHQLDDSPGNQEIFKTVVPTIVFAEGQEDKHLPKIAPVTYVLHNCSWKDYESVPEQCLALQVYSNDVLTRETNLLEPYVHHQKIPGCYGILYQPWATDLLPHEINPDDIEVPRERVSNWVGTIGSGRFGNIEQISGFERACDENSIEFSHTTGATDGVNRELIRKSYLAPAIVGKWQAENGYIPCRAFKNVSYGQPLLTNSTAVRDLFSGTCPIFNEDTYALFMEGREFVQSSWWQTYGRGASEFVRDHHTFVNRIQTILKVLS